MPSPNFPFRIEFPPDLPISARADEIVAAIAQHPVVILAGETGSGKTTQIPKMCLAAGRGVRGRIACTQPRRVAALSISRRVAEELGVEWGREVGCKVRFSDQTSNATVVKFLTDGMLLAEVQGDPMLRGYDTIIVDEAHERSLNIDFLLGHLRQLRHRRRDLRIIITSATIDTQAFSEAFDGAPVIQVSGRTYPVETAYLPLDVLGSDYVEESDEAGQEESDARSMRAEALHYVDGAVEAVRRVFDEGRQGDILIFMPSERDIRETCDLLEGELSARRARADLVPLFGRLSNAEQQRVFAPSQRRKIIVATNIAETSLTIPGIRVVIDTGLVRMSRYAPTARTRRLPIEPISQSSADQRKGRAGRVAEGLCIRLYSEDDYEGRPRFTQPEIQRANLADVILRLKAFGLGDIERFPFINPPAPKAVRSGYALLEELGALAPETRPAAGDGGADLPTIALTDIGRELARLPVDPTVGRMILQARSENCLQEVLAIASGLSIQDPRERPLDKQAAADAAHRRFAHPDSDFLTLLNIWETYHEQFDRLSQARLRRFCHDHFLSYVRMREWRDIHSQLVDVLRERDEFRMSSVRTNAPVRREEGEAGQARRVGRGAKEAEELERSMGYGSAAYRAIHRSVLAGLLGNIAVYDEEAKAYKATNDRKVALFPGSVLFPKDDKRRSAPREEGAARDKGPRVPRWIVASEIVETSRVYARTCAKLDPRWVVDLGRHLLRVSHSEPFWNAEAGRVMVRQRTRLYGLELETRAVGYGKIDPVAATDLFIREGLVNDTITWPLEFLAHNRKVRERIEFSLTRLRDAGYLNLDEALRRFYAEHLMPGGAPEPGTDGVSSVPELIDLVRRRRGAEPHFLMIEPEDLRDPESLRHDAEAFPETLPVENRVIPLAYAYKPGQEDDGVTLDVNVRDAGALTPASLDWAVPGHVAEKVEHYLRALPKDLRRAFIPFAETVPSVVAAVESYARLRGHADTLTELLGRHLKERFGLSFDPKVWNDKPLPPHLCVRVRVVDDEGRELCASRDLREVHASLGERQKAAAVETVREDPDLWKRARVRWEKPESETWTFGDVPASVVIGEQAGLEVLAWPALRAGKSGVGLWLARDAVEASALTQRGLFRLLELQLSRDLGWLERDLKSLRQLGPLGAQIAPIDQFQQDAFESLRAWLCAPSRVAGGLTAAAFASAVEGARADLRGLVPRLLETLREIVARRHELVVAPHPYPGLTEELAELIPADFLRATPYPKLQHVVRYLKARRLRLERWRQNPAKDAERAAQVAPLAARAARLGRSHRLYWMVEELRVSLFAQELGTAESVSVVKLERLFSEARHEPAPVAAPPPRQEPAAPAAPLQKAKSAPLKSLTGLDSLFRK
ncbi:ATP-dependent RNA helicase HrpB [mine drainage metagenome]|uniref:ATP-dependent RNA helicase HrpB n=1 Tax=mine drainage metagenome TaxID=410659 RepID=A0A1J5SCU5_9ZZZZ